MVSKKIDLFGVEGKEPSKPKLPTLKQYLQELTNDDFPNLGRICIIWFPGRWDNYSIETSNYRASIGPSHPLYKAIETNVVRVFEGTDTAVLLGIRSGDGTLFFSESNVYGRYERIGSIGYRFIETPGAN